MKIEKITLSNLTSIEGEQTIDFTEEPLRSAGLFAITGDMGSGKSTILDAICLALYNKAPRFDNVDRIPTDDLKLAVEIGNMYHACHISCKESVEALRQAKQAGGNISAEVTAHHLLLEDKDVQGHPFVVMKIVWL